MSATRMAASFRVSATASLRSRQRTTISGQSRPNSIATIEAFGIRLSIERRQWRSGNDRFWHIASFRCDAEFGRHRGADIARLGVRATRSRMIPNGQITRSPDVRPEHRRAVPEITLRADLEICIIFVRNSRPFWITIAIGITCLGHTCPITHNLPLHGAIVVGRPVGPLPREQKQVLCRVRRPECLQPRIVLQQMIEQVASSFCA